MMLPPNRKKGTARRTKLSRLLKSSMGIVVGGNPWRKIVKKVPLTTMVSQMGTPTAISPININIPTTSMRRLLSDPRDPGL
jgi:hypothetical protein